MEPQWANMCLPLLVRVLINSIQGVGAWKGAGDSKPRAGHVTVYPRPGPAYYNICILRSRAVEVKVCEATGKAEQLPFKATGQPQNAATSAGAKIPTAAKGKATSAATSAGTAAGTAASADPKPEGDDVD